MVFPRCCSVSKRTCPQSEQTAFRMILPSSCQGFEQAGHRADGIPENGVIGLCTRKRGKQRSEQPMTTPEESAS